MNEAERERLATTIHKLWREFGYDHLPFALAEKTAAALRTQPLPPAEVALRKIRAKLNCLVQELDDKGDVVQSALISDIAGDVERLSHPASISPAPGAVEGLLMAAKWHDERARECRSIASVNQDNELGPDCELHATDHEVNAMELRELARHLHTPEAGKDYPRADADPLTHQKALGSGQVTRANSGFDSRDGGLQPAHPEAGVSEEEIDSTLDLLIGEAIHADAGTRTTIDDAIRIIKTLRTRSSARVRELEEALETSTTMLEALAVHAECWERRLPVNTEGRIEANRSLLQPKEDSADNSRK